jgi:hypothetical protein
MYNFFSHAILLFMYRYKQPMSSLAWYVLQQVAVFSRTWRAPARHMFTWLESFYEMDMPTLPLRASPSIHSCEIIFGETTAEKCANFFSLRRKVRKLTANLLLGGWDVASEDDM